MFAYHLLLAFHAALATSSTFGSSEFDLCCDFGVTAASSNLKENTDVGLPGERDGFECHISIELQPNETLGEVCFHILCWSLNDMEQLTCNLEPQDEWSDRGGGIVATMECISMENINVEERGRRVSHTCERSNFPRCSLPLQVVNKSIKMVLLVSSGDHYKQSTVTRFIPRHLSRPQPPTKLHYTVTTEGQLLLTWSDTKPPTPEALTFDIRYISNISQDSWFIRDIRTQEVSLTNLSSGLPYVVQVRSHFLDKPFLSSNWSTALNLYLHEVTYVPETMVATLGSNITIHCVFNNVSLDAKDVVWWLNTREKVPEGQHSAVNNRVSRVTLLNVEPPLGREFSILQCCPGSEGSPACSYSYATIYFDGAILPISCSTNGELTAMTCRWNTSQPVSFLYQVRDLPCSVMPGEAGVSLTSRCPVGGQGVKSCTLKPLLPVACYRIWLAFGKEGDMGRSRPIRVTPMELVKPHPPYNVLATTDPKGFLNIQWNQHELPVYELQYEVLCAVNKLILQWKVLNVLFNQSITVKVLDPCSDHIVQVRCRHHSGLGLWSDWSPPSYSWVSNTRAPERGPDFWRIFHEDFTLNLTNVTLLILPVKREQPDFCIDGLLVKHHTIREENRIEMLALNSSYTFPWGEETHNITVSAYNALGSSDNNSRMTLIRRTKRPWCVSSFSMVRMNRSCLTLTWTVFPNCSALVSSFIVEWKAQTRGASLDDLITWVRVPRTSRIFSNNDNFLTSEECLFTLYPIFTDGEGQPVHARENKRQPVGPQTASLLLLMAVIFSAVLVMALGFTQHQMMKLVWQDVPDPNNCSWAHGVDFTKGETVESLFSHNKRQSPLLLEMETFSEAVVVEKTWDMTVDTTEDHSCGVETYEECLPSYCISYATVLPQGATGLHCKHKGSLSSCSDEGNFSANSDVSICSLHSLGQVHSETDIRLSYSLDSVEEFLNTTDQRDGTIEGSLAAKGTNSAEEALPDDSKEEEDESPIPFLGKCEKCSPESVPLLKHISNQSVKHEETISLYIPQLEPAK